MKKLFIYVLLQLLAAVTPCCLCAESHPFCRLVITPTAGSLSGRSYIMDTQLFDGGGIMHMIGIGVTDLVNIGVSYGGSHIIGSTKISWQPHAAFQVRIRIVEESMKNPAVSIGFDSQGDGAYLGGKGLNRFLTKSRGVYAVVSRNYRLLGNMGFHGGVNYSLEEDDGDRDPSFWAGLNKSVGNNIEVCGEYDFATNDNERGSMNVKHGYLNSALKWSFGGVFTLEFDLKNILRNDKMDTEGLFREKPQVSREIRLFYQGRF